MSTPNPPSNYRVVNQSGIKKLYFDVDTGVIQTKVFVVEITGDVLIGSTSTNFIVVPPIITGDQYVKSQSEGDGGWGVLNDPAVSVDFGS
jgi:hypothetical protein